MKLTPAAATRTRTSSAAQARDRAGRRARGPRVRPGRWLGWRAWSRQRRRTRRDLRRVSGSYLRAVVCMFMHMTFTVAVAGASGYAGGEMLRLLLGAPRGQDRRAHRALQRGHAASARTSRTCARSRTACSCRRTSTRSRATTSSCSPCRTAPPARSPRELGARRRPRPRLRCRPPARRRRRLGAVLRLRARRAPGPTACPSCCTRQRTAAGQRARPGGRAAHRRAGLQRHRRHARAPARRRRRAASTPTDLVAVLAVGYSGAGKALKTHLLAIRGARRRAAVRRRRHAPAHPGDRAEPAVRGRRATCRSPSPRCSSRCRAASSRRRRRRSPPAPTRARRAGRLGAGLRRRAVRHLLPEGQWPTTAATLGANTALVQVAVDARRGPRRRPCARSTTSSRAPRAAPCSR